MTGETRKVKFTATIEMEVEVEAEVYMGTPPTRSQECPMGYPGDPVEVLKLKVVYVQSGPVTTFHDITEMIGGEITKELEYQAEDEVLE